MTGEPIPLPGDLDSPSIFRQGLGYRGIWPRQGIVLTLSGVRTDRGDPSGLLDIWFADSHLLGATRVTLTGPNTRRDLSRDLQEQSGYDGWRRVLDLFCREVIRQESEAEDITWLSPWPGDTRPRYLVDPVLRELQPNTVFGPGGAWKSTLATGLALAVSTGFPLLDWVPRVGRVLVLDWETDRDDWCQRATELARGHDIAYPHEMIAYRHCSGPLHRQTERLAGWVAEHEVRLVILDSVMHASGSGRDGGDPAETAVRLFESCRQIGSTWLLIDHVTGDNTTNDRAGRSRPYGSVLKENSARSTWELRAEYRPDAVTQLVLSQQKANRGQPGLRFGLHGTVDQDRGAITLKRGDVTAPDLYRHAHDLVERLVDLLKAGPMRLRQIAEELGENSDVIRMTVRRHDRRFVCLSRGVYALKAAS